MILHTSIEKHDALIPLHGSSIKPSLQTMPIQQTLLPSAFSAFPNVEDCVLVLLDELVELVMCFAS